MKRSELREIIREEIQRLNEGKWQKIMKAVRAGEGGPWTAMVITGKKVIHQETIKIRDAIPAYYEDIKKKFGGTRNITFALDDSSGQIIYTEKI